MGLTLRWQATEPDPRLLIAIDWQQVKSDLLSWVEALLPR